MSILEKVGRYEIIDAIATGGMAEVYEVRDLLTSEHHALKLLVEPKGRQLFDLEYEIMNRLNHPSVVRIYLYGRHKGLPWFSMEHLTAQTASKYVKESGKAGSGARNEEVVRVGALAARALHHVHARGVIHRDVKAANVLVLPDQRVKLVDFGVSHLGEPGGVIPAGGGFRGTLGYASPEQIRQEAVDHRSDLYALGALVYRLATGRMPFKYATPSELVQLQMQGAPPDPSEWQSGLPAKLVEVVRALLERDPENRPKDAGAVADVLDSIAGRTHLPGAELALHRTRATTRQAERTAVLQGKAMLTLLVGPDQKERARVLRDIARSAQDRGWSVQLARVQTAGDRATLQGMLVAAREVGNGVGLFAVQLVNPVDPGVVRLLRSVIDAIWKLPGTIRLVVGCGEEEAAHFKDADTCQLVPLSRHETALAIGAMVGRRPPAGSLAERMYAATRGWPSAVEAFTRGLVASREVEAEGNQILWSRFEFDVQLSEVVSSAVERRLSQFDRKQQMVLSALARVEGLTPEGVLRYIPHTGGGLTEAIDDLVARGMIEAREEGLLYVRDAGLAAVLKEQPVGSTRASIELLFGQRPDGLPPSSFRVAALLRGRRLREAVAEALALAKTMIAADEWSDATELLRSVYLASRGHPVTPEVAEALLLYARCAVAYRAAETQEALQAVASARELGDPVTGAWCDLMEAELQLSIGHYANYARQIAKATQVAKEAGVPELLEQLLLARGKSELWAGNLRAALRAFEEVDCPAGLAGRARCALESGRVDEAEELALKALSAEGADELVRATALRVWADALRRQGRFSEALTELRRATGRIRTHPDQRPFLTIMLAIGWCEADLHRLGLAQECVDELAAATRKTELLHYRVERDLLDAWIAMLSGRAMHADYALQGVAKRARTAGLRMLADQAHTLLIEAQHANRMPREDVGKWYESRRIAFMADKLVWAYADACLAYIRHHPTRPDPEEILKPVMEALSNERAFSLRIETLLIHSERAIEADDSSVALMASRDAAELVARVMTSLSESERGAFRVHPWNRRIGAALATAKRISGVPARRR